MARRKSGNRRAYPRPTMTYLTPDQRRQVDDAAERDGVTVSTWVRRLIAAQLPAAIQAARSRPD